MSTPRVWIKKGIPHLQRFLTWKVFNSDNLYIVAEAINADVTLAALASNEKIQNPFVINKNNNK